MSRNSAASKIAFALILVCAVGFAFVVRPYIQGTPYERDWIRSYIGFYSGGSQFAFVVAILIAWITLSIVVWWLNADASYQRLIDRVKNDRLTKAALLSIGGGILGLLASIARFVSFI